jgi:NADPH:quinone reductase-like Zn-dependent oxidoreductase
MRAVQIVTGWAIDALKIQSVPDAPLGPGQVRLKVRAVSLNFRDMLVVKGLYSKKLPLPLTICSDCAAEVAETGPGVTRVKTGDRVSPAFMPGWIAGEITEAKARTALGAMAPGVLAEHVVMHEDALVAIPGHLSDEEAATLPCAAVTAWHALVVRGGIKAGDTVLTLGTGGVSLFAVQIARMHGARVISTSSSDEKLTRVREVGAEESINYRTNPAWEETVRKMTGGGVDHVIEVGGTDTLNKSIRAVRMGGRIALIGNVSGAADANLLPAFMKNATINGIFVGSREMFEAMNRAIAAHKMRPVVDRVFEMDQIGDALRHMESGAHFGKIVVKV